MQKQWFSHKFARLALAHGLQEVLQQVGPQLAELEVVGEEEGGEGVDGAEHSELGPVGHAHAEGDQRLQGIRHLAREAEARLAAGNFGAGKRNDPQKRLAMKKANISKTAPTERSSR